MFRYAGKTLVRAAILGTGIALGTITVGSARQSTPPNDPNEQKIPANTSAKTN